MGKVGDKIAFTSDYKENDNRKNSSSSKGTHSDKKRIGKWLVIMAIFLISIGLSLYVISPYSLVEEVTVEGTNEVYVQDVLDASLISSGGSLWQEYVNKGEAEKRIVEENPQVSDAKITLSGLQEITITIDEYDAVAYLLHDNRYSKILENGVILDEVIPRPDSKQAILSGFSEGPELDRILELYPEVDEQVKMMISEIEHINDAENPLLIRLFMTDGNQVTASIPTFPERINYYPDMVEAVNGVKGTFDLEAGAFFVPFESEEASLELEEFDESEDEE
ncbi:cell division protein FtsQ/DivIB [Alkalibacterium sp. MB6]|uniref:cell division protein FtsQ/DivIB n=1 Tax=Alkalibacterium sp. MB6 TaxID=2081965 RepID=UPI00137B0AAD|nr:FtsQ-type POTRA domain-containing protein [Alkalibacterium sp. MB6]